MGLRVGLSPAVLTGVGWVSLCPQPVLVFCPMTPRLSVGAALFVWKSPVRVCTACPGQPELIIVVVTVSPLIPRIPLPPARRGLQINKSSLGAGASKLTYAPADGSTGTFPAPGGGRGAPASPQPEAATLGCQSTLPSSGSELCPGMARLAGDRLQSAGQLSPVGLGNARRHFGDQDWDPQMKYPGMPGGSWGPGPARV